MDVAKFVSIVMFSSQQAHVFHLQTPSYAQHKALEDYYTSIVGLIDSYVEVYQGTYMKIIKPMRSGTLINDPLKALSYFIKLKKTLKSLRTPTDSHLRNIQDTIMELVTSTIYKLKFLS
jgi:hypothetical protein